jgi:hypothetical protein
VTFYRWAVRNGAKILFFASLLIFVVSFAARFFIFQPNFQSALSDQGITGPKVNIFTDFWTAFGQAASSSVWSFFGACLLHRLDRHWGSEKEPRQ